MQNHIEDKFFVVKMVQDHRRRRDRDKKGGDFGVIDEAMRAVQRWEKRLPVFHLIDCGTRPRC